MCFHTFMTNNYCDDDPCLEFTLDYKLGKKIRSNMYYSGEHNWHSNLNGIKKTNLIILNNLFDHRTF